MNIMFFCAPADMKIVQSVIRSKFDWHESAAKFMQNDGRSKFASYCTKYALKSLADEGTEANPTDAWYSVWAIRRYQFFGIPNLSTWRELRKIEDFETNKTPLAASIWRAARRGDGAAFISLNGGLNIKMKDRPVRAETSTITNSIRQSTKSTEVELRGEVIYRSSRPAWRITLNRSTPRKANKFAGLGVILQLSKENQNPTQNPKTQPQNHPNPGAPPPVLR